LSSFSIYGYAALEATNHPRTTILQQQQLQRNEREKKVISGSTNVTLRLLGCVESKRKDQFPQLLYALTRRRPEAPIQNLIQTSAWILASSKQVFYGKLCRLLNMLRMDSAELCYVDTGKTASAARLQRQRQHCCIFTDSALIATADYNFVNLLEKEFEKTYEKEFATIFEDPDSLLSQAGLFKLEGIFVDCYFRCCKAYWLGHEMETGIMWQRMKSIPQ